MFVKWISTILLSVLLSTLVFLHPVSAEPVNGYGELVTLIEDGNGNAKEVLETIQSSQKTMLKEYLIKQNVSSVMKRHFNFQQPIGLHHISDQYFAISFEADTIVHNLKTTAVWVLLYKRSSPENIAYANEYIVYETAEQVAQYKESPDAKVCERCWEDLKIKCDAAVTVKTKTKSQRILLKDLVSKENFQVELAKKANISHGHSASEITSGTLQEKFIDDAICRDSELAAAVAVMKKNAAAVAVATPAINLKPTVGRINELEIKTKEIAVLQAEVAALQKTVSQLSRLLEGVSRKNNDIIFSKVNLHIVNGTGKTEGAPNGLGNLIVGYNELPAKGDAKAHSGSHNVVIGKNLTYTSYGGLVVGEANAISGPYAVVSGGYNNRASGKYACVGGGQLNNASGDYATVSGGLTRKADKNNNWAGGDQYSPK